jgi:hypothetical protein
MRQPGALAVLTGVGLAAAGALAWLVLRRRKDPAEKERLRRLEVNRQGRMGDGSITDVSDGVLYYSYTIRGVEYTTSQDVSTLRNYLPQDLTMLMGPVTLKFIPNNPFNSILLCEQWSGVRGSNSTSV